jgi:hypothetical protein
MNPDEQAYMAAAVFLSSTLVAIYYAVVFPILMAK